MNESKLRDSEEGNPRDSAFKKQAWMRYKKRGFFLSSKNEFNNTKTMKILLIYL